MADLADGHQHTAVCCGKMVSKSLRLQRSAVAKRTWAIWNGATKQTTVAQRHDMLRLRARKWSLRRVAAALGVHHSVVAYWDACWEADVTLMDTGGTLQDNASSHKSAVTLRFLQHNNVPVLRWPPNSPDLSPIENMWAVVKGRVDARRPRNIAEVEAFAKTAWRELTGCRVCMQPYFDSMPRRLEAVLKNGGGPSGY